MTKKKKEIFLKNEIELFSKISGRKINEDIRNDPFWFTLCIIFTLSNNLFNEVDNARRTDNIEMYLKSKEVDEDLYYKKFLTSLEIFSGIKNLRDESVAENILGSPEKELVVYFYCIRNQFIRLQHNNTKKHIEKHKKSIFIYIILSLVFGFIIGVVSRFS